MLARLLSPIVEVRRGELGAVLLMFASSFLAMTAYNAVKPLTRSQFIRELGAANLPYVLLAAGLLIGVCMAGYTWAMARLPRRWGLPIAQGGLAALLVVFYALFRTGQAWVSVGFYLFGLLLGVLLISQFWTLANVLYDPRQAKRLFGFIGGGAPLGGTAGSALAVGAERLGALNLLLIAAALLALCAAVVSVLIAWRKPPLEDPAGATRERGVGPGEAFVLLRRSPHLQVIALVISFAAIGAALIEQQLNMAAEASKGRHDVDAMTAFLGLVGVWMSALAFLIQVWLTSRIQRLLGIGAALLVLPIGLGTTAVVMLLNAALWAPALARVLDQSLRYTVDKTTREILFLPLPADVKLRAKAFVDVTVDRVAKAVGALLLLVLVQPWGFGFDWQRISYASLAMVGLWAVAADRARRGYLQAFRRSLARRDVRPSEMPLAGADAATVEVLVEELAQPDEARVLNAIDLLEALDKRHLVTPLLFAHASPRVRARSLQMTGALRGDLALQWLPAIERLSGDADPEVRAAAVTALATLRRTDAAALARAHLASDDPRLVVTAAVALATTGGDEARDAEAKLWHLVTEAKPEAAAARRELAVALRRVGDRRLLPLLVPLVNDPVVEVAEEAIRTVGALGAPDPQVLPGLVARLAHRRLKSAAREALRAYGAEAVSALAFFLHDPSEPAWVRRHLPATLARLPCQASMDALVGALAERDGFLRYKALAAIEHLARDHPELAYPRPPLERLVHAEMRRYYAALASYHDLADRAGVSRDTLLLVALAEKQARALDRLYRLLGLLYPGRDVPAARWAIEHGDARARATAAEYLDNVLAGPLRHQVMPILDDSPAERKLRRAHVVLRTRARDEEDALLSLINDDDPVIAALAIDLVRERGVWALEPDLEHVLAHRDAADWPVFEAASWALADRRLPGGRARRLWREPLPVAAVARALRQVPLFRSVAVDELFRLASAGHQRRVEAGTVIARFDTTLDTIVVIVDGRASARDRRDRQRSIEPPALAGVEEVLAGRLPSEEIRTSAPAVLWEIDTGQFQALLADNPDLVAGLFRTTLRNRPPTPPLVAGHALADVLDGPTDASSRPSPARIALWLRRFPVLAQISADELQPLAALARPVSFERGVSLSGEGDPPAWTIVLAGELVLEPSTGEHEPATARSGDLVGFVETLAGEPLGRRLRSRRAGWALRVEREDLFDLMEQRPRFLREFLAGWFAADRAWRPA
jgi:AAA family ATP:ADP antiporter